MESKLKFIRHVHHKVDSKKLWLARLEFLCSKRPAVALFADSGGDAIVRGGTLSYRSLLGGFQVIGVISKTVDRFSNALLISVVKL